jgi:hypothetical protein
MVANGMGVGPGPEGCNLGGSARRVITALFAFALLLTVAGPAMGGMALDERGDPIPVDGTVDRGFNPDLDQEVEAIRRRHSHRSGRWGRLFGVGTTRNQRNR